MSYEIRISDHIYNRLEKHVQGFDDTPENVIDRLLDFYETYETSIQSSAETNKGTHNDEEIIELPIEDPGDLRHTKILNGQFQDESIRKWNELLHVVHKHAFNYYGSFQKLREVTGANIEEGSINKHGFKPCKGTNFSIQNEDANHCWRNSLSLAKQIQTPSIKVLLQWEDHKKAAYPGQRGRLFWTK